VAELPRNQSECDMYEVRREGKHWAVWLVGPHYDAFVGKWRTKPEAEAYATERQLAHEAAHA
jgi:hypothetical protein